MDVNATLLVQLANFLVSYLVLRSLILRPTYGIIADQESRVAHLQARCDEEKKSALKIEMLKQQHINELQRNFSSYCFQMSLTHAPIPDIACSITPHDLELATNKAYETLVNTIPHIDTLKIDV